MEPELTPEAQDAVHKVRNAQQAVEIAREQQTLSLADMVQERFEHVLSKGTEQEKAIILARVPYICQDIKEVNAALKAILAMMEQVKKDLDAKDEKNEKKYVTQESFNPFKWALTVIAGVILTTIVGALLAKIIIH